MRRSIADLTDEDPPLRESVQRLPDPLKPDFFGVVVVFDPALLAGLDEALTERGAGGGGGGGRTLTFSSNGGTRVDKSRPWSPVPPGSFACG